MTDAEDKGDFHDPKGRVLIIAGSDPSGGAGIQADIKAVTALGGYAATAITALTVQNTKAVTAVHAAPQEIIAGQIAAVLSDIGADAIKTGSWPIETILDAGRARLLSAGFGSVDYFELRDADTLKPVARAERPARVLAAAWLGRARLIDNVPIPGST